MKNTILEAKKIVQFPPKMSGLALNLRPPPPPRPPYHMKFHHLPPPIKVNVKISKSPLKWVEMIPCFGSARQQ